jgi:hypothetical protein
MAGFSRTPPLVHISTSTLPKDFAARKNASSVKAPNGTQVKIREFSKKPAGDLSLPRIAAVQLTSTLSNSKPSPINGRISHLTSGVILRLAVAGNQLADRRRDQLPASA